MFVVRIKRPNEDFDFKALKSKKAATARFRTAQTEMIDGVVEDCALFDAPTPDAGRRTCGGDGQPGQGPADRIQPGGWYSAAEIRAALSASRFARSPVATKGDRP